MEILHSQILGNGKPFLILHGFLGMGDNWKTMAGKISEKGYCVHILDMRNHGRSFHSNDFSYKDMSQDVLNYMNYQNIEKAYVLGHSMGGKAAMLFSCKYPERVERLIVADISPKVYPAHHKLILSSLETVDFDKVKTRADVEEILSKNILDLPTRMFLLKNLYWKTPQRLDFRMNLAVLKEKYYKILEGLEDGARFDGETLFLKGEKSNYINTEEDKKLIEKHFPNSKIETICGAGHWLHAEKPDQVFKAIEKIL